ncbi:glycoside hydrolase family 5 protein [Zopfia rhizophila CBS 207.26]|uniref:Glycoside hydrolase family 5 protein n=1 Tax=Zopfia rhizophila CBS 207.26 TaxID=1314779 RepID=A0A6A6DU63_9PEZI|nr:glycoside hydrolase family 5 protein [Zopfia rhizophila CBS 207.26]
MKGLLKKAKAELQGILDTDQRAHQPPAYQRGMEQDQPSTISTPTALEILRYRYHHGSNLGSIYVLERWLHPSMFPRDASGSSELEAVKAWVEQIGLDATRQKFEDHWANAASDSDLKWLSNEAKCTTIRLPIGYFDLPSLTEGTPFASYAAVYTNAWSSICTLISRLRSHSIGVLLDLHALPGGANKCEHSGTNSGVSRLWSSSSHRDLGTRCCRFVAEQVAHGLDGVVGVQIVNEAEWESEQMYEWYDDCISVISSVDTSIPVIISDGWDLRKAVEYCLKKNVAYPAQPTCPVVIDTHYYWAFSDADKTKSPQQIIGEVDTKLTELDGKEGSVIDRGAVQVWVGEYSCVLTEESWSKSGDATKEDLVKQFGNAQSDKYQARAGGGFFWTWKMDWFPGGEWGFAAQISNNALTPPSTSQIDPSSVPHLLQKANHHRDHRMYYAVDQHVAYWDHLAPNTPCEHWRYENGWRVGYQDALIFFQGTAGVNSVNQIGNLELWVMKRIRESGFRGNFVWEFEQGVRRGIQDFESIVGV